MPGEKRTEAVLYILFSFAVASVQRTKTGLYAGANDWTKLRCMSELLRRNHFITEWAKTKHQLYIALKHSYNIKCYKVAKRLLQRSPSTHVGWETNLLPQQHNSKLAIQYTSKITLQQDSTLPHKPLSSVHASTQPQKIANTTAL